VHVLIGQTIVALLAEHMNLVEPGAIATPDMEPWRY
jgi:hypothetical protein